MRKSIALIFVLATVLAYGQNAKVVPLSAEDAAKAKSLYEEQDKVNREISDLQAKIKKFYLSPLKWPTADFQFSEDFKYVVPSPVLPYITTTCCNTGGGWILNGCANPAIGTVTGGISGTITDAK